MYSDIDFIWTPETEAPIVLREEDDGNPPACCGCCCSVPNLITKWICS